MKECWPISLCRARLDSAYLLRDPVDTETAVGQLMATREQRKKLGRDAYTVVVKIIHTLVDFAYLLLLW